MFDNKIYKKYTDPKLPGAFSGLTGFIKNNKGLGNVKRVIKSIPAYTLHKPIEYAFDRTKTIVDGIDHQWQVDLVDVSNTCFGNSNVK